MPQVAFLIPILTAVAAAGSAAVGIDELVNQPGKPKPPPTGPQPITSGQSNAVKAAIGQQAPDIVAQTGGSVSPAYTMQLAELLSGTGNVPGVSGSAQSAINNLFGLGGGGGGPTTAGVGTVASSDSGSGVSDFKPAGLTGGNGSGMIDEGLSDLLKQFS